MATTISRQPRSRSVRGAGYRESEPLSYAPTREIVGIDTPYGEGIVERSTMRTPNAFQMAVDSMSERFGNTPDQIRERENTGRDRYNAFLESRGINPDSIGTARLTGNAYNRGLDIPSVEQEFDAINLGNRVAGMDTRDRIAANRMRFRNPAGYAEMSNRLAQADYLRGPNSAELRRDYWLNRLGGAYDYRATANGYGY